MLRTDLVLAGLASGGQGASYPPAQVQKLFFLIDREIPAAVEGPHFQFSPYDFGPFDAGVYHELDRLHGAGLVRVDLVGRYRRYSVTDAGWVRAQQLLPQMHPAARDYVAQAARWVLSLPFAQLVSAIYQRYPEMKARSIFKG